MGEAFFDLTLIANHQPYKFSTHLMASTSLTFPRYPLRSEEVGVSQDDLADDLHGPEMHLH